MKVPGGIHTPMFAELNEFIGVTEDEIAATIINFMISTKTLTEGAGIMGLAALLYKHYVPAENEKIAIVVCGGNIDLARIQLVFKTGLISMGRLIQMKLLMSNGPGFLLKFCKVL